MTTQNRCTTLVFSLVLIVFVSALASAQESLSQLSSRAHRAIRLRRAHADVHYGHRTHHRSQLQHQHGTAVVLLTQPTAPTARTMPLIGGPVPAKSGLSTALPDWALIEKTNPSVPTTGIFTTALFMQTTSASAALTTFIRSP